MKVHILLHRRIGLTKNEELISKELKGLVANKGNGVAVAAL